ncbi:MAG: PEP-CTERM sorting domain-containing protein, partial [Planctomycetota bacterium]
CTTAATYAALSDGLDFWFNSAAVGDGNWETGSNGSIAAIQITPIIPALIPEPASMSLLVLGGVATLLKKRRNRR